MAVEVKAQLQRAELKHKRLIEQFKKTSQELREVVYQLLGFRVDISTTGQYRLINVYAESATDYFLFQVLARRQSIKALPYMILGHVCCIVHNAV